LLLAIIAFVFSGLLYLPFFKISAVVIEGAVAVPENELRAAVEEGLNRRYFGLIPAGTVFSYPAREIESGLLKLFPRLETANLFVRGFSSLSLKVVERQPAALWCDGAWESDGLGSGECYFLDADGFAFETAPVFSGNPYLRYVTGTTTAAPSVGSRFLPPAAFRELQFFAESVRRLDLEPLTVFLSGGGDAEMTVSGAAKIIFSLSEGLNETLGNLTVLLNSGGVLDKMGKPPLRFDYIDLRFGNKIFYKRR